MKLVGVIVAGLLAAIATLQAAAQEGVQKVNVHNFVRAETDMYFGGIVKDGAFGRLVHKRQLAPIEQQSVVRMNRDTLYSSGVFDLDAGPVTVTLPDADKRFMSLLAINQDHYAVKVAYAPGRHVFDRKAVGTRYMAILIRTLVNSEDARDVTTANRLQDAIVRSKAPWAASMSLHGTSLRRTRRVTPWQRWAPWVASSTDSATRTKSTHTTT
jgi:hypothetical protein